MQKHIRISTYNIHQCIGRDGIQNLERIVAVLNEINADIIALQEVTSNPNKLDDMLAFLAATTEMKPIEGFTLITAGTRYGNALLSKWPVSKVELIDISVRGREPRGVIQVCLNVKNKAVVLWATHLGLGIRERHQQVNTLLEVIDAVDSHVSILLGDFNEWLPWGRNLREIYRRFSATKSPASFPSGRAVLKLDRIWVRPVCLLTTLRAHATPLSRIASDHLPLVAEVALLK